MLQRPKLVHIETFQVSSVVLMVEEDIIEEAFVEIGEVVEEDPTLPTVEEEEVFLTKIS